MQSVGVVVFWSFVGERGCSEHVIAIDGFMELQRRVFDCHVGDDISDSLQHQVGLIGGVCG